MYVDGKVRIYHTQVEPLSSGERVFRESDHIVDIDELHKSLLNSSAFVVLCNDVSKYSELTEKQYFIVTDKLTAEEGYEDSFVFAHFGRSTGGVTNRKILMSFGVDRGELVLKASYFNA